MRCVVTADLPCLPVRRASARRGSRGSSRSVPSGLGAVVLWGGCSEAEFALPYLPFVEALGNHVSAAWVVGHGARSARAGCRRPGADAPAIRRCRRRPMPPPTTRWADCASSSRSSSSCAQRQPIAGSLLVVEDIHWADALDPRAARLPGASAALDPGHGPGDLPSRRAPPAAPLGAHPPGLASKAAATFIELEPFDAASVRPRWCARSSPAMSSAQNSATCSWSAARATRSCSRSCSRTPSTAATSTAPRLAGSDARSKSCACRLRSASRSCSASSGCRRRRRGPPGVRGPGRRGPTGPPARRLRLRGVGHRDGPRDARRRAAARRRCGGRPLSIPARPDARGGLRRHRPAPSAGPALASGRRAGARGRPATGERARHLFAAARFSEAVPVGLQAATEAEDRQGFSEAADLLLRALPYVDGDVERARLLVRVGGVIWRAGDPPGAERYSPRRSRSRAEAGDVATAGPGHLLLGRVLWEQSRQDVARTEYERARDVLDPLGPSRSLAEAYVRLASLHAFDFEYERPSSSLAGDGRRRSRRRRRAPSLGARLPGPRHMSPSATSSSVTRSSARCTTRHGRAA